MRGIPPKAKDMVACSAILFDREDHMRELTDKEIDAVTGGAQTSGNAIKLPNGRAVRVPEQVPIGVPIRVGPLGPVA